MNNNNKNTGYYNSGYRNSGNFNSGKFNSGDCNSGNFNSGHRNSGNFNSGHHNSGKFNSGNFNSGNFNSGHYNSGNRNSGYFNTDTPTVRMFNKDTGLSPDQIIIPYVELKTIEWVDYDKETSPPEAEITGGHLIKRTYKEAWALAWSEAAEDIKEQFKALPNFCPDIFKEITGIDVRNKGNIKVVANGKEVFISKEAASTLGLLDEEE